MPILTLGAMPDAGGHHPAGEAQVLAAVQVLHPDAGAPGEGNRLLLVGDGAGPQVVTLKLPNMASIHSLIRSSR